eukprot:2027756-Amphidinium_carterae.1
MKRTAVRHHDETLQRAPTACHLSTVGKHTPKPCLTGRLLASQQSHHHEVPHPCTAPVLTNPATPRPTRPLGHDAALGLQSRRLPNGLSQLPEPPLCLRAAPSELKTSLYECVPSI